MVLIYQTLVYLIDIFGTKGKVRFCVVLPHLQSDICYNKIYKIDSGSLWVLLSHSGSLWVTTGYYMGNYGPLWANIWAILGQYRSFCVQN